MNEKVKYALIVIKYLLIDYIWIYMNRKEYNKNIRNIQGFNIQLKVIPAILTYIVMLANIYFVIIPASSMYANPLIPYGVSGLVVYGVYNLVNLSTFADYSLKMTVIDTLWGFVNHIFLGFMINKFI